MKGSGDETLRAGKPGLLENRREKEELLGRPGLSPAVRRALGALTDCVLECRLQIDFGVGCPVPAEADSLAASLRMS